MTRTERERNFKMPGGISCEEMIRDGWAKLGCRVVFEHKRKRLNIQWNDEFANFDQPVNPDEQAITKKAGVFDLCRIRRIYNPRTMKVIYEDNDPRWE